MESTTIASSTIAVEKIERSPSPTPSNSSSIYSDFDDEEVELPVVSITKDAEPKPSSPPPTRANPFLEASFVDERSPNTSSTTQITKDTEQDSISHLTTPPSTPPTRPSFSFQKSFDKLDISPSSRSDRSNFSNSTLADEDPQSPITQTSSSPLLEPLHDPELPKPQTTKPTPKKKLPCLQCQLANLYCSLSGPPQHRRTPLQQVPRLCCTRCARNGESFCILQVGVEQKEVDRGRSVTRRRKSAEKNEVACTYLAEGRESEVVVEKAQEMLEAERAKMRFALPAWSVARENLKPVFGGWLEVEEMIEHSEV